MKKYLSILLTGVLLVVLFCGCNSDASAMKKLTRELNDSAWKAISATDAIGGVIYEDELVERMGGMVYEFDRDGTVLSTTLGETLTGTWEVTAANTVSITLGEANVTASKVADTLEIKYLGSTFVLVEQE